MEEPVVRSFKSMRLFARGQKPKGVEGRRHRLDTSLMMYGRRQLYLSCPVLSTEDDVKMLCAGNNWAITITLVRKHFPAVIDDYSAEELHFLMAGGEPAVDDETFVHVLDEDMLPQEKLAVLFSVLKHVRDPQTKSGALLAFLRFTGHETMQAACNALRGPA